MGGPGGVTGQPSTWITQLVASLLRQIEDPDRLVFLADAHAGYFMHEIHTAWTEASMLYPSARVFARPPRALSRFVASALSARMTPCWIGSAALSVSSPHFSINTHGSALLFHLAEGGVLSFQCGPLFPPSSHLWSLGPVSLAPLLVSSHMATNPIPPLPTANAIPQTPSPSLTPSPSGPY